ncbi:LysE family translocator [Xenorhabdus sp. KJ12.1]|uniref:LysE family translocator n=1 Tax=Xenorhabdus sp. KJ12.1 TaxID=1851571 RepID=UPI000C05E3AC|nr:LysE family translocator [Xenorhabdus sp. KJ12.1]PHM71729.1 lysine transporter LysE [Xenorhabdus sp. KJ12.1]
MLDINWGLFLVASLTINAIPGADVVYVTGKYYTKGKRSAVLSATGLAVGYYFYIFITWLGITAILLSNPSLFGVIQLIGAVYLIWMGKSIIQSSPITTKQNSEQNSHKKNTKNYDFLGGFVISVLNPKVGLFFVSFFPQFITSGSPSYLILILGSVFCLGATFFNMLYCFLFSRIQKLSPNKSHLILGVIPGIILIFLGCLMIYDTLSIYYQ